MEFIRHTKTITNLWATTQVVLKKQIAILESNGDLNSVFEGLELKRIQFMNIADRAKFLGDLKDLLKFSLTRTMIFPISKAA